MIVAQEKKSKSNKTIAKNPKVTKRRATSILDSKVSTRTLVVNPNDNPYFCYHIGL